jgi:hypothetical protein
MKFNIGDLVRYSYPLGNPPKEIDVGVVTDIDEFGEFRIVWASGSGVGWYICSELVGLCKSET